MMGVLDHKYHLIFVLKGDGLISNFSGDVIINFPL